MTYCNDCERSSEEEHEPWCTFGDPGRRKPAAILWQEIEELHEAIASAREKVGRLAAAVGLPPDWDDE